MSDVDTPSRDLSLLAPGFRKAILAAIADCEAKGFPVKVNEAFRSQARQAQLFAQGRTRPGDKVTNAPTSLTSWHGYGLAIDVIHLKLAYWPHGKDKAAAPKNEKWFRDISVIFKEHGCTWGGDWKNPDTPHMQWGRCTASPTDGSRLVFRTKGVDAVWDALKAL